MCKPSLLTSPGLLGRLLPFCHGFANAITAKLEPGLKRNLVDIIVLELTCLIICFGLVNLNLNLTIQKC